MRDPPPTSVLGARFGMPNGLVGFRIPGDLPLQLSFFLRSTLCPVLFGGQERACIANLALVVAGGGEWCLFRFRVGGAGCLVVGVDGFAGATIGQDMIDRLVSKEDKERYARYLFRSYIEDNPKNKWCPAPGCDYAVEFVVGIENYDVSCLCSYGFCWNCAEEAHRPVDCGTVAKWIMKNSAESENTNWILAYTKSCPKCKRPIEKNHGCMHMTCAPPCGFYFCWLCLGALSDHEAWLQIVECRRVLKWTYAYGYYLPEPEHAKRQFFEYLQGEAEAGLERLHQCAETDVQAYLGPQPPPTNFNHFRTKLARLTSVTRNYFENLVRALENGLSDVDSQGASSKTATPKIGAAVGKGKRGRGKASSRAGRPSRSSDDHGSWTCDQCTYFNTRSLPTCEMCHQPRRNARGLKRARNG
ncbi:hypothetical protein RHSIM_Rhsim09G0029800 [Rhododendron simsii]|uniref:RBR-type E3 ubiquitin transferase n=1 Tax=Rhododendron simsii TaxID=118357 RepID=A0A834LEC4_RHOSS|nr:hypothetical protein RHSIM_Rhsim09G0029800 [Rhododendron simsii]